MNFTFRHSAVLIIMLYLCLPVVGFAHADISAGLIDVRLTDGGITQEAPCDQCPCSDEHGSDCCGASVCGCAFQSPPEQALRVRYAPVIVSLRSLDSFWVLPQVYLPIFVPPQNMPVAG